MGLMYHWMHDLGCLPRIGSYGGQSLLLQSQKNLHQEDEKQEGNSLWSLRHHTVGMKTDGWCCE